MQTTKENSRSQKVKESRSKSSKNKGERRAGPEHHETSIKKNRGYLLIKSQKKRGSRQ